jgi:Cu+-exporting ATPase
MTVQTQRPTTAASPAAKPQDEAKGRAHRHGHSAVPVHAHDTPAANHSVKDPVCGMSVDPEATAFRADYHGENYFFCSSGCQTKFKAEPARYAHASHDGEHAAHKTQASREEPPEGAIYTCPMHPEIRQMGPGNCPICGMALEPVLVTADEGPSEELRDMTRRFWVGLTLALPVFLLEMGGHIFDIGHLIGGATSNWIQLVLATPVVLWAGWPFFVRGWQSLVNRSLNMFTLIAMGTGIAWLYSVIATLAPGLFPPAFRAMTAPSGLFRGGRRHHRAGAARPGAGASRPRTHRRCHRRCSTSRRQTARIADDGRSEEMSARPRVQVGDRLRVRPGDKVPSTAKCWRAAPVDESMVTGEPLAGRQDDGRQGDRRYAERPRLACHARRKGRRRHDAVADRADGRQGAAQPRADPAARRHGVVLVRAARGAGGARCLRRLGDLGAPSRHGLWPVAAVAC